MHNLDVCSEDIFNIKIIIFIYKGFKLIVEKGSSVHLLYITVSLQHEGIEPRAARRLERATVSEDCPLCPEFESVAKKSQIAIIELK